MNAARSGPVEPIASQVDRRLEELLAREAARWGGVHVDAAGPVNTLAELVRGGKRLRPAFCYWAYVGAGGDPDRAGAPSIVDAGAALELLHAGALVHDDVIDRSATRRGRETAHVAHAARHARNGWLGDSRRFGEGVAVVTGDLAIVYSGLLMLGAPEQAAEVFAEMSLEVNVGQYLDILGAATTDTTPDFADLVSRYKTAKYSVERPLHLGAALADPDRAPDLFAPLSRAGLALGEAFQLRDDVLGVYGDHGATGKPVGDDLREGKATRLATLARSAATGTDAELFATRFGRPDLSETEVQAFQAAIEATGARASVEERIAEQLRAADEAIRRLPLAAEARGALARLAALSAERDR